MATDIYFVTDLQNAQQLTELLNDPGSILNFNPCNADIKEKRKSIFSKKKKKNWPVSVEALRKVVLYSKQRKAHYEIAQVGQGQWQIMETPIEEVYVRNLRTLRVVPWLQKLFMPGKKKKNNKPLFPPPRWSLKPSKHKSQNKAQPQLPPAKPAAAPEPEPAPQPEQQQQQQQQREEEEELRQEPPVPAQHQERRNSAGVAGAYDADAGGARVNVVGSANDLFGDNGELRSAAEIGAAARPLLTVQEDHREAFPEGPPLQPRRFSAYRSAYGPAGPANNGGPGGAYSTWPPPKQRSRGNHLAACAAIQAERAAAAQAAEAAEAAEAAAEGGAGAKQQQPGRTASLTMTPTSRLSNMHEVTLRDIVGVDDDVLAWEAQRKGAAGDQAAKLNAAREDLEERVRRQQEEQVAHAANRRAERAEVARVEAEFQAALRLEQKRLQNAARASLQRQARARSNSAKRHPHSKPAPAPPGAADAVADDDFSGASARVVYPTSIVRCGGGGGAAKAAEAAAPAVVYPTTIVRRGSAAQVHDEEEQRRQQRECCDSDDGSSSSDGDQPDAPVPASAYLAREAAAMQEREDMRRAMRSQPGWGGKVQELAEFGGVSTVSAEAVLENFHGNLKAGKLYFLERMSFA